MNSSMGIFKHAEDKEQWKKDSKLPTPFWNWQARFHEGIHVEIRILVEIQTTVRNILRVDIWSSFKDRQRESRYVFVLIKVYNWRLAQWEICRHLTQLENLC